MSDCYRVPGDTTLGAPRHPPRPRSRSGESIKMKGRLPFSNSRLKFSRGGHNIVTASVKHFRATVSCAIGC